MNIYITLQVSSVMHLRAKISRARANWLLVKSRLKDIARYQTPQRTPEKTVQKPSWGKMRDKKQQNTQVHYLR